MGSDRSRLAPRLAFAYAALFGWMGVYLPYWPVWLADRGMSSAQIGILLAMAPWTRVIASPVAGRWADRSGRVDPAGAARLSFALAIALVCLHGSRGLRGPAARHDRCRPHLRAHHPARPTA